MPFYVDRDKVVSVIRKTHSNCDKFRVCGGQLLEVAAIMKIPLEEAVPVIRCKDCILWNEEAESCRRTGYHGVWKWNDYCRYGKRGDV